MGAKKKILLLIVLVGIGVSSFFVYRYYLLNKTSNLAAFIPAEANVIVYLNTRACWAKMKDDSDFKMKQAFWKKSVYFRHLESMGDLGIDFTSDLAYVENSQIQYVLCLLNNADKFSKQVEVAQPGLFSSKTIIDDFQIVRSLKDSFYLIWNKNLIYIVRPNKLSVEAIIADVKVKDDNNFLLSDKYKDIANPKEILWFYVGQSPLKKLPYHQFKGCVRLDSGILILATQNLKQDIYSTHQRLADLDSLAIFYCGPKHFLNQSIRELSILHIGDADDGVLSLDFDNIKKILILGGREIRERKFLAYAYDDDFNKLEREYVKRDTVKACELYYKYASDSNWMKMYNSNQSLVTDIQSINKYQFKTYLQFNQDILSSYLPLRFRKQAFQVYYSEKMEGNKMSLTFNLHGKDWKKLIKHLTE